MSDRREPKWMRLSLERALLPQPQGYLYVMSRADGWHKIGVSGCDHYRKFGVSYNLPARLRPVVYVKSWPVYGPVYMAEKLAHERLVELGYERGVGDHQTEWFNASEAVARKVVRAAIAHVASPENVRAVIKARAKRISQKAWQREKAGLVVRGGKAGRRPKPWPSPEVEAAARRLWLSKNIQSDAAAIREAMETWPDVTERMMRNLGKSGRNWKERVMRLPAKRLYRVEYYVIGRNGGHIGKNVVAVDAYNRDDAMSVARRMGYTPIKIV